MMIDRNTALGFAAVLLWSTTVALARRTSEQLGPLTAGAAVFLAAGLFLSAPLLSTRRAPPWKQFPPAFLYTCGSLFVLYMLMLFLALGMAANRGQTIEIGLLNYLWPSLTLLLSLLLLRNRAGFAVVPGTALALVGVFLVLTQDSSISWKAFVSNMLGNPQAYALGALAGVTWALYSNLSRRLGHSPSASSGGSAVALFTLAAGAVFLVLALCEPARPATAAAAWTAGTAAEVAVLATATALAYLCWDIAMRKGNMVTVVSFSYLTPFFSTVVSCLYLHVLPGARLWAGCLLIIAGSLLTKHSIRTTPSSSPDPD